MRCSCRACGTYMVQTEHGLMSGCRCPDCGNECRDCMGSAAAPLSPDALRSRAAAPDDRGETPNEWEGREEW